MVAGLNYSIHGTVNDHMKVHVRAYKPLPHTGDPIEIKSAAEVPFRPHPGGFSAAKHADADVNILFATDAVCYLVLVKSIIDHIET